MIFTKVVVKLYSSGDKKPLYLNGIYFWLITGNIISNIANFIIFK